MTTGHAHQTAQDLAEQGRRLREFIPDVYNTYGAFGKAVMVEGTLSAKSKELIALAIAVSKQCDGCISSHGRGAARAKATRQEVAEALGVAIMMNGGPGTVWAARAFDAFEEFAGPETE
jgi:AhpD family alkylhydroperoxidase